MWPFSKQKSRREIELEQLVKQREAGSKELNAKLETTAAELNQLRDALETAERSVVNLTRENKNLAGDYKVIETDKSYLETKSKTDDAEIKRLNEKLTTIERKYEDKICGIEKWYQDQIDGLKTQLDKQKGELQQANEERQKAYKSRDDANQRADRLRADGERKERAFVHQLGGVQKTASQKAEELAKQKEFYVLTLNTIVKIKEVLPNRMTDQELAEIASYLPTLSIDDATEVLTQLRDSASANDRAGLISKLKKYSTY